MRRLSVYAIMPVLLFSVWHARACTSRAADDATVDIVDGARLTVQLDLDPEIYSQTRYRHAPQFAVWIENAVSGECRTLYVTQKLGRGSWNGKPIVPVALPYWVSQYNKKTGTKGDPTSERPVVDAITQPTPTDHFQAVADVARGTKWHCYVEVNVSGDFNDHFPAALADGTKDIYGNGQPSLVYRAVIEAKSQRQAAFKLVGRTSQIEPSPKLTTDLDEITTAKKLFSRLRVSSD